MPLIMNNERLILIKGLIFKFPKQIQAVCLKKMTKPGRGV